eukprot:m.164799 g.164799  ORF g.164799 m.164799 type:complete len:593 (+) comp31355_c0_seq1:334-2112(+)
MILKVIYCYPSLSLSNHSNMSGGGTLKPVHIVAVLVLMLLILIIAPIIRDDTQKAESNKFRVSISKKIDTTRPTAAPTGAPSTTPTHKPTLATVISNVVQPTAVETLDGPTCAGSHVSPEVVLMNVETKKKVNRGVEYCQCVKPYISSCDTDDCIFLRGVDYGPWPVMKNFSLFPLNCMNKCTCSPPQFNKTERALGFMSMAINNGLAKAPKLLTHEEMYPQIKPGDVGIDLVLLSTPKDYAILFNDHGLLSMLRHFKHVRTVLIIGQKNDSEPLTEELKKMSDSFDLEVNKHMPPIHFINEDYYLVYRDVYQCPYLKVCQQLMKLAIFDLPYLLDDVVIVDADTVWFEDIQFIYPNRSAVYHAQQGTALECGGGDGIRFINKLFAGSELRDINWVPKVFGQPCQASICTGGDGGPEISNPSGLRHILHHMVFQRDVMESLHTAAKAAWDADSLWEAVMSCWKAPRNANCKGRVSEYEMYFNYLACAFPQRIIERVVPHFEHWNAAGDCSLAEQENCRKLKNPPLFKSCHSHRRKESAGMCLMKESDMQAAQNSKIPFLVKYYEELRTISELKDEFKPRPDNSTADVNVSTV